MKGISYATTTIWVCCLVLGVWGTGYAQGKGNLEGKVIDKDVKVPLSSVNVIVTGGGYRTGTFTGVDGDYVIENIPPGKFKVEFSIICYKTLDTLDVEILAGLTTRLDVELEMIVLDMGSYVRREEITDPEPEQISSTELMRTVIAAHMDMPNTLGKNVIYCSTFQIAWNMMQDSIIKEDIQLVGDPEIARMLNKQLSTTADISEDCYVAMVGFLTQEFLDRINRALKEKFGDQAPPEVVEDIDPAIPRFLAYAYLFKSLEFEHIFKVSDHPIYFRSGTETTKVKAFEVESKLQRDQVTVLDYINDNDFIISLRSKSVNDEIILAKIPPKETLLDMIQSVQERISKSQPSKIAEDDPVRIPKCDFDVEHSFEELLGVFLKNTGWEDWYIYKAYQWIRFRLNEKGVVLKSEARFGIEMSVSPVDINKKPRHFIFDKPFLICLKQKDGRYPYFAMWVDNGEMLLGWEE